MSSRKELPTVTRLTLKKMTKAELQEAVRKQDRVLKRLRCWHRTARSKCEHQEEYIKELEDALAREYLEYVREIEKIKGAS
jgi:restriction endonuclease Mrr